MENSFFTLAYKELLDISTVKKNNLESSTFCLLDNFAFYFNCNLEKKEIDFYIEHNLEKLIKSFQSLRKTFIIVNNQNITNIEFQHLKYYFPTLKTTNNYFNVSQSLLNYFNYSGTIKTGLVVHNRTSNYNSEISIFEINNNLKSKDFEVLFDDYFKHLKSNNGYIFEPIPFKNEICYSPIIIEPDEIELNHEDKAEIELIIDKLNEIRTKGNFITLLPLLEKHLQDQKQNNTKLSRIHIDQDYKIWLVDYDLEVKMSHLTKSIYFLFLAIGHKISFSDLKNYEKCLINIYKSISNQENLDKMHQSVNLLIRDKNAIYVHLSRIKAAFHKLIYKNIAEKYCIQGPKGEPKGILLPKEFTNIDTFLAQWDINPKNYSESKSYRSFDDDEIYNPIF